MMNVSEADYMPSEIFTLAESNVQASMATIEDSADIFDEDGENVNVIPVVGLRKFRYVSFGPDDKLPFEIIKLIGVDEVMSQNKLFNVLTCYGAGQKYMDIETDKPTTDPEIKKWLLHNSIPSFTLEQATDMKYFFYCVSVIILSNKGDKIVKLRHKEACYCRFEKADEKGKIRHVFYANFRKSALQEKDMECIQLLDEKDPLGDLEILMGREPGPDGRKRIRTNQRKFAILVRFPTPGFQYYPVPYYTAIFRGDWFDIKRLIGKGKKAKLKNHAQVKYQVEVHKDYWMNICEEENLTDPVKQLERIKKEKENIKKFVSGIENSGKVWITGYYIDPNGREIRMVRITVIDTEKEGGDWSEDIQEASNITCYGDNIHPNLVGATPGKSQSNNSGSDKRELFTLKQSLEIAFHDLMYMPHNVVIHYNKWGDKVYPDVPMILLTTLDQNTDAKKKSANIPNKNTDDQD
jgi:hypothetical protein